MQTDIYTIIQENSK